MSQFPMPTNRAIRRMSECLIRGGVYLDWTTAEQVARMLSAPRDRPSMVEAAKAAAGFLTIQNMTCTSDALLEAAAALRNQKSWNMLATKLPAEHTVLDRLPKPGEARVWIVQHAHSSKPVATGLHVTLEAAEFEVDCYTDLSPAHHYRIVEWVGPEAVLLDALRRNSPSDLLASQVGNGRIRTVGERLGTEEPPLNDHIVVLREALASTPLLPGQANRHPIIRPLMDALVTCASVDDASAAIRDAADKMEEEAARIREMNLPCSHHAWMRTCTVIGALREANAKVWRLESDERMASFTR